MNCYQHVDRPAQIYCRNCGRGLCAEDRRESQGHTYCPDCLPAGAAAAPPAAAGLDAPPNPAVPPGAASAPPPHAGFAPGASGPLAPNPGLALALGFIPGVGAIYNGQYLKAVLQIVIFGSLIALSNGARGAAPIFGIGAAAFYFYMVLDSFRTARALSYGQPVEDFPGLGHVHMQLPVGALILIGLGGLLLLENLGLWRGDIFKFLGPALLIFFGIVLLRRRQMP